ncbi:MAG: HIT domain-containing protein [Thermoprotei archaeon]
MTNCVFCGIVEGSLKSYRVYENQSCYAFLDTSPITVGHTLVVPRVHALTLPDLDDSSVCSLFRTVARLAPFVVKATQSDGFRLIQNNGEAAAQVIGHVHVHIVPMKRGQSGLLRGRLSLSDEQMESVSKAIVREIGSSPV